MNNQEYDELAKELKDKFLCLKTLSFAERILAVWFGDKYEAGLSCGNVASHCIVITYKNKDYFYKFGFI